MEQIYNTRSNDIISFMLSEKLLTITTLGSIFTFQFITALKINIIDPIFEFLFPNESFSFLNVKLRDGIDLYPSEAKKISIDFGSFFKALIIYLFQVFLIFVLYKYTKFPDIPSGNITGAAIM